MKRLLVSGLLFFLLPVHLTARIPFICKIRKVDCSVRPDSLCCKFTSTTPAPASQSSTTTEVAPTTQEFKEREENEVEAIDPIEGEPSHINEVVVNLTGEPVETEKSAESTKKPTKFAPRFCLKLKFNCKLRARHPCCKHPLPPSEEEGVDELPSKISQRQPRKQTSTVKIKEKTTEKVQGVSKDKSDVKTATKTGNTLAKKEVVVKPKQNVRPRYGQSTGSSLFKLRRRPSLFGSGKSALCRIVSCTRNKDHDCCKSEENASKEANIETDVTTTSATFKEEETTTTTTEAITTEEDTMDTTLPDIIEETTTEWKITTQRDDLLEMETEQTLPEETTTDFAEPIELEDNTSSTLIEETSINEQDEHDNDEKFTLEERGVVSQKSSVSAVERRIVQTSGIRHEIDQGLLSSTLKNSDESEGSDKLFSEDPYTNFYSVNNAVETVNVYPVYIPEEPEYTMEDEVFALPSEPQPLYLPKLGESPHEHDELPPVFQPEYLEHSPVFYYGVDVHDAATNLESQNADDNHKFHSTDNTEDQEDIKDAEYDKRDVYEVLIGSNQDILKSSNESNLHSCSQEMCLSQPNSACCSPHKASKRQTTLQFDDFEDSLGDSDAKDSSHNRVTATVTRTVKSISWV